MDQTLIFKSIINKKQDPYTTHVNSCTSSSFVMTSHEILTQIFNMNQYMNKIMHKYLNMNK